MSPTTEPIRGTDSDVDGPDGVMPTPEEDGSILALSTGSLDLTEPITCDWRPGDVWWFRRPRRP